MNEDKFTGIATVYAKYRPTYPDALINYLYTQVGISKDSIIADIGSGTGILTKLLLEQGSVVYAVEPNEDMAKTAEHDLRQYNNFNPINGAAEKTGLEDSSIDFITVAQAFHWFDREKFKAECKRLLKDDGKVILIWNSRDGSSDIVMENDDVLRQYCPDFKGFSGGRRGENPEAYSGFFKDGICDYMEFNNDLIFDEEGFIGRNLSASYSPKKGTENYQPFITSLKQLFAKYSSYDYLCMPHYTKSFVGSV